MSQMVQQRRTALPAAGPPRSYDLSAALEEVKRGLGALEEAMARHALELRQASHPDVEKLARETFTAEVLRRNDGHSRTANNTAGGGNSHGSYQWQ